MPLYEYRCSGCGETFEQLRRMQDADRDVACPVCASRRVERLLSTFASKVGGGLGPCGQPASTCGGGSRRGFS